MQKLYIEPDAQGMGHSIKLMETALNFAKEYYTHCYLRRWINLKRQITYMQNSASNGWNFRLMDLGI
ncbi:GNAT superfamily N-acetyltransferase [Sporosarcina luteola]|nr:GNAT superfamily N-acetyltransferase [Sporosarcina luteola]